MSRAPGLPAVAALLLLANAVQAQNLLANPDFDAGIAGWTIPGVIWIDALPDDEDWAGDLGSGSARVINTAEGAESAGIYQCVQIPLADGATAYDMRVQARAADGQQGRGTVEFTLWYYDDGACSGSGYGNDFLYWGLETWPALGELGLADATVPAGTQSILFELRAAKYAEAAGFEALFDHAYLPESGALASSCAALLALAARRRCGVI